MFRVDLDKRVESTRPYLGQDAHEFHPIMPGDKVKVELSPYDLSRGRIVYRSRR